jgi:hypothetical protein
VDEAGEACMFGDYPFISILFHFFGENMLMNWRILCSELLSVSPYAENTEKIQSGIAVLYQ